MIKVGDFASRKGIKVDKAIQMIKDGFYISQIKVDQWYVSEEELITNNATSRSKVIFSSDGYQSQYGTARGCI